MAVQFSYEDFKKAAQNAGLLSQFSQADLSMAKENPNFGMSVLGLKQNWQNAATDEEKQQINAQANSLRSSYGNYTGGADGSQYISTGLLPNKIDDTLEKVESYAPFSYDVPAPAYTDQYADQRAALLSEILNRPEFSWNKENDPSWSAYKKEYLREGDRATTNALAQASAASGGIPSSYALTAAGQAGDYYAAQLTDKIPELYQQAYERYLNEQNLKYSDLSALNAQEQLDYAKYQDQLAQYNTDRNFAYNDYQNQYNMLQDYLANLQGQQQTEFNQGLTVQQYQDQIAQQQEALKQQELQNALTLAEVFGYVPENGADALGLAAGTPTAAKQQYLDSLQQYQDALKQQEFANALSLYQSSGYVPESAAGILGLAAGTPTADQAYNEWYMAQQAAKAAVGNGGNDGPPDDTKDTGDIYSNLAALGAKDAGTAYAMLLNMGYSSTEAKYLSDYFESVYYPNIGNNSDGYKILKYADLSADAKKISDLMDSELTTNYDQVLNMIEQLKDESEQNYLLTQLKAYLK